MRMRIQDSGSGGNSKEPTLCSFSLMRVRRFNGDQVQYEDKDEDEDQPQILDIDVVIPDLRLVCLGIRAGAAVCQKENLFGESFEDLVKIAPLVATFPTL